jgi:hypothetical protein
MSDNVLREHRGAVDLSFAWQRIASGYEDGLRGGMLYAHAQRGDIHICMGRCMGIGRLVSRWERRRKEARVTQAQQGMAREASTPREVVGWREG